MRGEGTFLQKGSLSPPTSPLLPRLSRLSNPRLRPFPVRREGQSAGCRKKPGNEKPGMTSIPGFRNCPGGGTQGRGEPQHDIVGRFHVRMASASGRKIWKNDSEMPPYTFSQEVHGEGLGREHPEGGPPPSASAIRLSRPQSCGRRAFRFLAGNLDAQHAILVGRGDLVGFDVLGQGEHAAERAV